MNSSKERITITKRNLVLGQNSIDFLKNLTAVDWELIDFVVFDPPYYDLDDPKQRERFHGRAGPHSTSRFKTSLHTVLMDSNERAEILSIIKENVGDAFILYFHSKPHYREEFPKTEMIWFKGRPSMSGGSISPNHEFMYIEELGDKKLNRFLDLQYINHHPLNTSKTRPGGNGARTAMKPLGLFEHFYKVLDVKCVLDPFAGFGYSIQAAINMGIGIYACDLDTSLESRWRVFREQKSLTEVFS